MKKHLPHIFKVLFVVVIVATIMIACLGLGYFFGRGFVPRYPTHVLNEEMMWQLWGNNAKAGVLRDLEAEGILPDSEEGTSLMKDYFRFEPYVFAHPFIILKDRMTSDYRIYVSSSGDKFDNFAAPMVQIENVTDETGTRKRHTTFILYRNTQTARSKELTVMVYFITDERDMLTNASFAYFDPKNFVPKYYYNDTDGDGIFDSVVFVSPEGKIINYAPKDFFETFTSANENIEPD